MTKQDGQLSLSRESMASMDYSQLDRIELMLAELLRRSERKPKAATEKVEDIEFNAFWQAYPMRKGRGAAVKAFERAIRKTSAATLVQKAKEYAAKMRGKDPRYIAHPTTWLNQERWLDEADPMSRRQATLNALEVMENG